MIKLADYQMKPLEEEELVQVLVWRQSDHVKPYMYTDHTITWDEHVAWYDKVKNDPTQVVFLLHYKNKPIGLVNFTQIDLTHSRCYWGFYIGEPSAPKGSGTVLGMYALDYLFLTLGLHKVCAEVLETNMRSYHYHRKLGFENEGTLKEQTRKENRYVDVFSMGLFSNNWLKVREKLMAEWKGVS